MDKPQLKELN
jgi:hypothetical protein